MRPWLSPQTRQAQALTRAVGDALFQLAEKGGFADAALDQSQEFWRRSPAASIARSSINQIKGMLRAGNWEGAAKTAAALIGLGEGLTPSGDDFCLGLLAASHTWDDPDAQAFRVCLGEEVLQNLRRTNDVSAQYLACAVEGNFSQLLLKLLSRQNEKEDLVQAALTVGQVGHSSGVDTLNGLYLGSLFHAASDEPQQ